MTVDSDRPQYWIDRWDEGRIGFHRDAYHPWLLEFGEQAGIRAGARVLVPLSGKSLDLLWIEEQGAQVTAIELAERAVDDFHRENERSFERQTEEGQALRYHSGAITTIVDDVFGVDPEQTGSFDVIYDRAALIALGPETRERYAEHLARFLAPNGQLLLITADYEQSEMPGPPYSVPNPEVRSVFGTLQHRPLAEQDILAREERWRERGLSRLAERCALLSRK